MAQETQEEELARLRRLEAVVLTWRHRYKPWSAECIIQADSVNLSLTKLAEDILDVVGYEPYEEED